ncbi:MAG TPA: PadR family transcriptional regulator, partial [Vicinamibacterales bacterium]
LDGRGAMNGYAIALHIERISESVLRLQEGSLYPALHRMMHAGWLKADWGASENGRRARYYEITPAGRRQLAHEEKSWEELTGAVARVLRHA